MLLGVDTATNSIGISLHSGARILSEVTWESDRHHTTELAPEVALTLRRLNISIEDLTAIAVAIGPGSYTGLRIGLAFAKGLAHLRGLPLVGVPTLDIIALAQPRFRGPMLASIRAGRSRIAGVWYKWSHDAWRAQDEARSMTWDEVIEGIVEPTYLVGEIKKDERDRLRRSKDIQLASPAMCVRRPGLLAELGWELLRSGNYSNPAGLVPVYLRSQEAA
jgi:tRNA threonylcarbamoyladenosine biosynthesis protein TsaB